MSVKDLINAEAQFLNPGDDCDFDETWLYIDGDLEDYPCEKELFPDGETTETCSGGGEGRSIDLVGTPVTGKRIIKERPPSSEGSELAARMYDESFMYGAGYKRAKGLLW